jgi:hypothetical protein
MRTSKKLPKCNGRPQLWLFIADYQGSSTFLTILYPDGSTEISRYESIKDRWDYSHEDYSQETAQRDLYDEEFLGYL